MTTLAEHIIVAGAENRPSMLDNSMCDSWASRILIFIKRKKHGRMMLDSIHNDLLVYLTIEEDGQTRPKKYSELTKAQQLQDVCDVQATNIILHGLPLEVYTHVNHQEAAKDIWDKVKLLMKGTELSYQEHKCRLYNFFDKFASFREWSKFVTDVKLAKSLYTTNYDQLNQATIQDGRVTVQQVQGRQIQSYAGTGNRGIATTSKGNFVVGQPRILDEEQLAFLADPGMDEAPVAQQIISQNAVFHTEDLDTYDSDCDDISSAKAVLMANLLSCISDVLSEVPYFDSYLNDMNNQDVQEMQYSEETCNTPQNHTTQQNTT
ncbi:hypothetical protein Tco_0003198 [Tanacetum coccineum]